MTWIILLSGCGNTFQKNKFICKWNELFSSYSRDSTSEPWLAEDRPDLIFRRVFTDGSWIMFRSQSIAGGSAFDATVSLDSNGNIFWTDYTFSGYEGLGEEVSRVRAESIEGFYEVAEAFDLREIGK